LQDIKTRNILKGTIKKLDKSIEHARHTTIKVKEDINNNETAGEYAGNKVSNTTHSVINYGTNTLKKHGKQSVINTKNNIKIAKHAIKSDIKSIKTSKSTSNAVIRTTKNMTKNSKRATEVLRESAKKTANAIRTVTKATISTVKAVIAGTQALITFLIAGGSIALIIIIIICLIGLLCSSIFGIFFSSQKTNTGIVVATDYKTMNMVVADINKEFMDKLKEVENSNSYDDYDITSNRAEWKNILAVYTVKVNNGNNATDAITLSDEKVQILKSVFWDMNTISYITKNEDREITTYDTDNNPIITKINQKILHITITSKTVDKMADIYNFTTEQKKQLQELLSDKYANLWNSVIYGVSVGNSDIVQIAVSQIGNVGGEPYWSWYGFKSRVEWCACYVSWCASECGYIDAGIIPKFAGVPQGIAWFKACDLWKDGGVIPQEGDIVFFDWDGDNSRRSCWHC